MERTRDRREGAPVPPLTAAAANGESLSSSSCPRQPLRIEPREGVGGGWSSLLACARAPAVGLDWGLGVARWRHQQAAAHEHEAMFAGLQRFVSEARWAFTARAARRKGLAWLVVQWCRHGRPSVRRKAANPNARRRRCCFWAARFIPQENVSVPLKMKSNNSLTEPI